jgi:hypothetical protein
MMISQAFYGISILLSFVSWGIIMRTYLWPALRSWPRAVALRPLLVLHSFRFIGLAFLIPGVVSPDLPVAFARPAAYGDFIAAVLALLSLVALQSRMESMLVWIFNLWGAADLIYAFYQGFLTKLTAGQLGAAYFIPTVLVPLLLITHGIVFRILLQRDTNSAL